MEVLSGALKKGHKMKKTLLIMGLILGLCTTAFAQEEEDTGDTNPVWTDDAGGDGGDTYVPPAEGECEGEDCETQE